MRARRRGALCRPPAQDLHQRFGPLTLERAWSHCDSCHNGFSPRDRTLGMGGTFLSPAAMRMIGIAAARTSFEGSSALLRELAGLAVAPRTVERHAEALGRESACDECRVVEGREGKQPDGGARTREAKLAVVWLAETVDNEGRPVRDSGSATRDTDIEPAPFARRVLREAERRVILGDGAPWIWNFADAVQIVDIFHAKGHLFEVAKAMYGIGSEIGDGWARKRREELDEGRVDDVIALRGHAETCEEARKNAESFSNNREPVTYPKFREMGLCVASGVVEGGCNNIVGARLKHGGMHWTVDGANAIIARRCAGQSNRFDDFWERRASAAL